MWPTHGPAVENPSEFIQAYIDHRLQREEQILSQLRAGQENIRDMVAVMYADVDKRLHPAAAHSVLAHMIHLVQTGRVIADGDNDLQARYSLPVPA